jgi:G3E family GTPase
VTVVDAENYSLDLFNSQAAHNQIAYGDIILLNKVDLVDEDRLNYLETSIQKIKDGSRILRTTQANVPLPLILSVGLFESDQYFGVGSDAHDHDHDHAHDDHHHHDHDDHDHDHDHHSHHLENDGFTSISFETDKPLAIRKFQHFLDNQLPDSVFRAKGILWFDESPKRHIFHLSGKRFTLDDDEWKGQPKNQLVMIGQNLDHAMLRSQLENCICVPSANRGQGFGKK